jgi:enediyne biosynthesis protein E4
VLGPVYLEQGRLEEALRVLEGHWELLDRAGEGASEAALNVVREYVHLRQDPPPVDGMRSALDRAARLAPEDDRVWLAKAHLAIRSGAYDEAARWLDACLRSRRDDVPAWRARLDWAVATNRPAEALEAMAHLPADVAKPPQLRRWAAWLAARRGDRAAERRALERLLEVDPANLAALDRLTDLADGEGQAERAGELRRRKVEIVGLAARYRKLYERNQPRRDAAEMGRLALRLGYRFEARAFLTRAAAVDRDRDDLRRELERLDPPDRSAGPAGRTVADVLAGELDPPAGSSPS